MQNNFTEIQIKSYYARTRLESRETDFNHGPVRTK